MADETFDLAAAVASAVPCDEYAALHPGQFDDAAYANAAYNGARLLMACASADPQQFYAEAQRFRDNPYSDAFAAMIPAGETRALGELVMDGRFGLTGFQWGYAVNAALSLLEQPPAPNPALITVSMPTSGGSA